MRFIFLLIVVAIFFSSCDDSRLHEENKDFRDRTWKISDTVAFAFRIENLQDHYNIYCNVRNTIDYPYARLFVHYTLSDTLGNELEKKLVSTDLFDQKTGKPNGQSGLGDIYDHRVPLLQNYEFRRTGKYIMKLEQLMRQDTLRGVLAVGIRLERTSQTNSPEK